ncbi:homoserine kinase [Natronomonas pharaonis DSM 2160]|uniref:Homoserine kinase n=1 Tax=Natronomonas pharaonis (strain ATCC 35678 / DSM 2160 / CIP 103997 / JCM 8858 / NBRC 14720 / NCIMB 2260 / Gabara) TaxID=348780 RepID=KHSE_NATPD|nr:homoserine kinase [Natronomonas pharaonis]Q3INF0.1 RecName: Full=Homoserine kinase; Short=HK; Short=HSK [Natronomonas pharaonis DSM 2160]CAI50353.1 homoserine kinase [Natronomonas pharaonis DSM 2160]
MITVRAPATSANLGSGFDVFGAALERPADILRIEKANRTTIRVTGVGSKYIPEDPEKNTVGAVAEALDAPAHIEIDKGVRPASGLGSSAASAAAAAVGLNELYDRGLSREELVPIAAEGEAVVSGAAHADNVAPSIMGGFTVAREDGVTQVDASIPLVACLPEIVVSTRDARGVVPEAAPMEAVVDVVGNAATLAVGMARDDPALVGRGMEDSIVTPERAELINGYETVRSAAENAGATGVTISGAGPTVIAACHRGDRTAIASAMLDAFSEAGVEARAYKTEIGRGAELF